jgi:sugar O-acyltransferase (sialic acid O-acetyltransferase NeuD family)
VIRLAYRLSRTAWALRTRTAASEMRRYVSPLSVAIVLRRKLSIGCLMSTNYVIYGAGGHSLVVIDILRSRGIGVAQVFDDHPMGRHRAHGDVSPGIRLVGADLFPSIDVPVILCVGRNNERAELDRLLDAAWGQAIHDSAIIAPDVPIGEGTVVHHRSVIQTNSRIGRHCLINTAASIDHDNVIGDFVHVSPHATLCGHVEVGDGTHIGAGAIVIPKVKIGRWCTVGAGAVVLRDVPDHATVVGNPARVLPGRSGQPLPGSEEMAQ